MANTFSPERCGGLNVPAGDWSYPQTQREPNYKIGDRVRVCGPRGHIGTVVNIERGAGRCYYDVQFDPPQYGSNSPQTAIGVIEGHMTSVGLAGPR
jgi:hypothetical protein